MLPMQGAWVQFLVRELDPTYATTKSLHAATKSWLDLINK